MRGGYAAETSGSPLRWQMNALKDHGITRERFDKLWAEQGGKCACCETSFAHPVLRDGGDGVKPRIDQCQGLLCTDCLGLLRKLSESWLRRALSYLERRGATPAEIRESAKPRKEKAEKFYEIEIPQPDGSVEVWKRYYD